jgi:hypothetical protein
MPRQYFIIDKSHKEDTAAALEIAKEVYKVKVIEKRIFKIYHGTLIESPEWIPEEDCYFLGILIYS